MVLSWQTSGNDMMNEIRELSDVSLELASGGVRDNPYSDANNQRIAAANGANGTLGGSLSDVIGGLVPAPNPQNPNPYSGGHPWDWP
jgi:hypothetical protein